MRPWISLYTKAQVILLTRALGGDVPVPGKGKAVTFSLPRSTNYHTHCRVEWTGQKSDVGKRLYKLTQYAEAA